MTIVLSTLSLLVLEFVLNVEKKLNGIMQLREIIHKCLWTRCRSFSLYIGSTVSVYQARTAHWPWYKNLHVVDVKQGNIVVCWVRTWLLYCISTGKNKTNSSQAQVMDNETYPLTTAVAISCEGMYVPWDGHWTESRVPLVIGNSLWKGWINLKNPNILYPFSGRSRNL